MSNTNFQETLQPVALGYKTFHELSLSAGKSKKKKDGIVNNTQTDRFSNKKEAVYNTNGKNSDQQQDYVIPQRIKQNFVDAKEVEKTFKYLTPLFRMNIASEMSRREKMLKRMDKSFVTEHEKGKARAGIYIERSVTTNSFAIACMEYHRVTETEPPGIVKLRNDYSINGHVPKIDWEARSPQLCLVAHKNHDKKWVFGRVYSIDGVAFGLILTHVKAVKKDPKRRVMQAEKAALIDLMNLRSVDSTKQDARAVAADVLTRKLQPLYHAWKARARPETSRIIRRPTKSVREPVERIVPPRVSAGPEFSSDIAGDGPRNEDYAIKTRLCNRNLVRKGSFSVFGLFLYPTVCTIEEMEFLCALRCADPLIAINCRGNVGTCCVCYDEDGWSVCGACYAHICGECAWHVSLTTQNCPHCRKWLTPFEVQAAISGGRGSIICVRIIYVDCTGIANVEYEYRYTTSFHFEPYFFGKYLPYVFGSTASVDLIEEYVYSLDTQGDMWLEYPIQAAVIEYWAPEHRLFGPGYSSDNAGDGPFPFSLHITSLSPCITCKGACVLHHHVKKVSKAQKAFMKRATERQEMKKKKKAACPYGATCPDPTHNHLSLLDVMISTAELHCTPCGQTPDVGAAVIQSENALGKDLNEAVSHIKRIYNYCVVCGSEKLCGCTGSDIERPLSTWYVAPGDPIDEPTYSREGVPNDGTPLVKPSAMRITEVSGDKEVQYEDIYNEFQDVGYKCDSNNAREAKFLKDKGLTLEECYQKGWLVDGVLSVPDTKFCNLNKKPKVRKMKVDNETLPAIKSKPVGEKPQKQSVTSRKDEPYVECHSPSDTITMASLFPDNTSGFAEERVGKTATMEGVHRDGLEPNKSNDSPMYGIPDSESLEIPSSARERVIHNGHDYLGNVYGFPDEPIAEYCYEDVAEIDPDVDEDIDVVESEEEVFWRRLTYLWETNREYFQVFKEWYMDEDNRQHHLDALYVPKNPNIQTNANIQLIVENMIDVRCATSHGWAKLISSAKKYLRTMELKNLSDSAKTYREKWVRDQGDEVCCVQEVESNVSKTSADEVHIDPEVAKKLAKFAPWVCCPILMTCITIASLHGVGDKNHLPRIKKGEDASSQVINGAYVVISDSPKLATIVENDNRFFTGDEQVHILPVSLEGGIPSVLYKGTFRPVFKSGMYVAVRDKSGMFIGFNDLSHPLIMCDSIMRLHRFRDHCTEGSTKSEAFYSSHMLNERQRARAAAYLTGSCGECAALHAYAATYVNKSVCGLMSDDTLRNFRQDFVDVFVDMAKEARVHINTEHCTSLRELNGIDSQATPGYVAWAIIHDSSMHNMLSPYTNTEGVFRVIGQMAAFPKVPIAFDCAADLLIDGVLHRSWKAGDPMPTFKTADISGLVASRWYISFGIRLISREVQPPVLYGNCAHNLCCGLVRDIGNQKGDRTLPDFERQLRLVWYMRPFFTTSQLKILYSILDVEVWKEGSMVHVRYGVCDDSKDYVFDLNDVENKFFESCCLEIVQSLQNRGTLRRIIDSVANEVYDVAVKPVGQVLTDGFLYTLGAVDTLTHIVVQKGPKYRLNMTFFNKNLEYQAMGRTITKSLEVNLKFEFAKPNSAPRTTVNYGAGAVDNDIPVLAKIYKEGLTGRREVNLIKNGCRVDVIFYSFVAPRAHFFSDISEILTRVEVDRSTIVVLTFSDDTLMYININGVTEAILMDISKCDMSQKRGMVMAYVAGGMKLHPYAFDIFATQITQLTRERFVLNPETTSKDGLPVEKLRIRVSGAALGSGTTATTSMNESVNENSIETGIRRWCATGESLESSLKWGFSQWGHKISYATSTILQKSQFLKHSPFMTDAGIYVFCLNYGAIIRSLGGVRGELTHDKIGVTPQAFKNIPMSERFEIFIALVVESYCNEPSSVFMDALRSRFDISVYRKRFGYQLNETDKSTIMYRTSYTRDRSKFYISAKELSYRYGIDEMEWKSVSDIIRNCKMFQVIQHPAFGRMLHVDYEYPTCGIDPLDDPSQMSEHRL